MPVSVPFFFTILMKETVRIIRFTIVGTLNAAIIAMVVWLLMHICNIGYLIANIAAYVLAQTNNFLWCKYWIFPLDRDTKKNSTRTQILFFLMAFALAYVSQFIFIVLLIEIFHFNEYLAQFLGLFVYGTVNFLSNKLITFK